MLRVSGIVKIISKEGDNYIVESGREKYKVIISKFVEEKYNLKPNTYIYATGKLYGDGTIEINYIKMNRKRIEIPAPEPKDMDF